MAYEMPVTAVELSKPYIADTVASADVVLNAGKPVRTFTLVVTDKRYGNRSVFPLSNFQRIRVSLPEHTSRHVHVRVYQADTFKGRRIIVAFKPRFRLRDNVLEILDDESTIAHGLKLRFNLQKPRLRRENRRALRSGQKSTRPNDERYQSGVPKYHTDGPSYSYDGVDWYDSYIRIWSGTVTADFRKKKANGTLPENPHHVQIFEIKDRGLFYKEDWLDLPGYGTSHFRSFAQSPEISGPIGFPYFGHKVGPAYNKAVERLRERAVGDSANLSETVATMNQTFGMIGNLLHQVLGSITNLKKGNITGAIESLWGSKPPRFRENNRRLNNHSSTLANRWLELQYGWKPLLADIEYLIKALSGINLADASLGFASASATNRVTETGVYRPNAVGSPPVTGHWIKVTRTTVKFKLNYTVKDPFRVFLSQSGFTNPVSLAWELLPFSFVGDWVLPIGDWLASLDQWGGLTFKDGCKVTFTRYDDGRLKDYAGSTYPYGETYNRYTQIKGSYEAHGILYDREALTSFPGYEFPELKNPFSLGHALNATALLRQVFR